MIISCPHCQTKYQVTYEAIGSAGRKVQCAHCQQAWEQPPIAKEEPPPEISQAEQALVEDGLDDAMSAQDQAATDKAAAKGEPPDKAKAARSRKAGKGDAAVDQVSAGKIDPSVIRKRRRAFSRPDRPRLEDMPPVRLRLAMRLVGAGLLVGVLTYAYLGRLQVVQRFPAMAGVYAAVGLGVNVVGLDITGLSAMQTLRNGREVLLVSAQIVGVSTEPVPVPAVVVTLIGSTRQGVYQWSVQPTVPDLMAGERSTFDTQLTLPPGEASRVRLSFAGGASFRAGPTQAAPAAAAAAPAHSAGEGEALPAGEAPVAAEHGAAATPDHATPEHP